MIKLTIIYFICFSVVKEEIIDESTVLPVFNGRVISWVSEIHTFLTELKLLLYISWNSFYYYTLACHGRWF